MKRPCKLSAVLLPLLFAGCATYEAQPIYTTTSVTGTYGAAPYYSPPVYYVEPSPVYVVPAPVYAAPGPAFRAQIQSGPQYRRHDRHRHRHGRGPHDGEERSGNAAGARIGGPGWSGSVWGR